MSCWGYGKNFGPDTWSKNFPSAGGKHQSPINIVTDQVEYDPHLETEKLSIKVNAEKSIEQTLLFQGHNFKIDGNNESMSVSGGPLSNLGLFKFVQLHFHWGNSETENGSEHQINGQRYPSEIHIVHYNASKYPNFNDAASHRDGLMVLGIFIEIGDKNLEMDKLMRPLSSIRSMQKANLWEEHGDLDIRKLLPKNTDRFYTYSGSLTTPPCYESVTWIVFEQAVTMTADQLLQFRWVHMGDECGTPQNFRPVCPLNDRKVKKSFRK